MDPNATLDRLRQLLDPAHGSRQLLGDDGYIGELTAAIIALDGWMTRGGHRPIGWDPLRRDGAGPASRLSAQLMELAAVAIIHRYLLDQEGAAQLRANLNGDLAQAAAAALAGDWEQVAYHTIHVRAAVQLRRAAREGGWLDQMPASWAVAAERGDGRGGVPRGEGAGEDQEATR